MIFWVSGDMSEDLRIKKLRGSGGFVLAQVTEEQQRKGNLGGPDLFLAPIGRLDVESVKKYTKTSKYDVVGFSTHCKICGDKINGLKCPRCEQKKNDLR